MGSKALYKQYVRDHSCILVGEGVRERCSNPEPLDTVGGSHASRRGQPDPLFGGCLARGEAITPRLPRRKLLVSH